MNAAKTNGKPESSGPIGSCGSNYHTEALRKGGIEFLRVIPGLHQRFHGAVVIFTPIADTLLQYVFGMSLGRVSQLKNAVNLRGVLMESKSTAGATVAGRAG